MQTLYGESSSDGTKCHQSAQIDSIHGFMQFNPDFFQIKQGSDMQQIFKEMAGMTFWLNQG